MTDNIGVELVRQRLVAIVPRSVVTKETVGLVNGVGKFLTTTVVLFLIRYLSAHHCLMPRPVVAQVSLMLGAFARILV